MSGQPPPITEIIRYPDDATQVNPADWNDMKDIVDALILRIIDLEERVTLLEGNS